MPILFYSTRTKGEWLSLDDKGTDATESPSDILTRSLLDFLRVDNLVVLTGLGTSLCVKDSEGNQAAPTMADLWDAVEEKVGKKKFETIREKVKYKKTHTEESGGKKNEVVTKDIELLLSHCHVAQSLEPDENLAKFIATSEAVIVDECSFVDGSIQLSVHESFLRRIARRSTALPRTRVFTTNYDLCFETAASRTKFIAIDGFSHTSPQEFDSPFFELDIVRRDDSQTASNFVPNVFHLYKLHGSVDWGLEGSTIQKQKNPSKPVLIYPRLSKFELSYEQPFLDIMSRFQNAIRQPKTALLIIGFGFADKHLVEPIQAALRTNIGIRVAVVDPSIMKWPSYAAEFMVDLIDRGDSRIIQIAAKFEEIVPLLPDIVAATEDEQHRMRLQGREAQ